MWHWWPLKHQSLRLPDSEFFQFQPDEPAFRESQVSAITPKFRLLAPTDVVFTSLKVEDQPVASISAIPGFGSFRAPKTTDFLSTPTFLIFLHGDYKHMDVPI